MSSSIILRNLAACALARAWIRSRSDSTSLTVWLRRSTSSERRWTSWSARDFWSRRALSLDSSSRRRSCIRLFSVWRRAALLDSLRAAVSASASCCLTDLLSLAAFLAAFSNFWALRAFVSTSSRRPEASDSAVVLARARACFSDSALSRASLSSADLASSSARKASRRWTFSTSRSSRCCRAAASVVFLLSLNSMSCLSSSASSSWSLRSAASVSATRRARSARFFLLVKSSTCSRRPASALSRFRLAPSRVCFSERRLSASLMRRSTSCRSRATSFSVSVRELVSVKSCCSSSAAFFLASLAALAALAFSLASASIRISNSSVFPDRLLSRCSNLFF
mmetsp:Transcript_33343/g.93556  ORF Transcript_33343/g.93556 Transcript_33343/m.93556 type:complete len:339 (+) Transcript_33343:63-1079(+)